MAGQEWSLEWLGARCGLRGVRLGGEGLCVGTGSKLGTELRLEVHWTICRVVSLLGPHGLQDCPLLGTW